MRRIVALALALCMIFVLAACGSASTASSSTSTAASSEAAEPAVDAVEASSSEELNTVAEETAIRESITVIDKTNASLAPWGTKVDVTGIYECYEMLYECDRSGEVYPILADANYDGNFWPGMDHEPGTGVYTVHIYDYIYDHAGNHITASDVAWSFTYQYQNESTSGWGNMIDVVALDDTTVQFNFTEEQNGLGELTNIMCRQFIVSEKAYNDSPSQLTNDMCGTGPYKMSEYVSGVSVSYVKNDNYWQTDASLIHQEQQANVENITYMMIDESAQKVIALETGAVDVVLGLDYESALDFADGGSYADDHDVYTYLQKFVYYINPNCSSDSIMSDVNMRLAVFNAIDVDGLIVAMGNTMTRLPAYASSYYSDYDYVDWAGLDNYNTKTSVDAAKVQEYLDAAGYNGEEITIINAGMSDEATIIAAQLAAFGINAKVANYDFSTINSVSADSTAWDLALGMMAGDYNVQVWEHGFSYANTDGTRTDNFVVDDEWNALLAECCTEEGHTSENMAAWWQMAVDNAYTMALYTGNQYNVIPTDMTYFCLGDKLIFLPGACTYAAD